MHDQQFATRVWYGDLQEREELANGRTNVEEGMEMDWLDWSFGVPPCISIDTIVCVTARGNIYYAVGVVGVQEVEFLL